MDILREFEKKDSAFIDIPLETSAGRFYTPQERLAQRIAEEAEKARKKGLPFCESAVLAETKERAENAITQLKRKGYVDEEVKKSLMLDSINWDKFSDLKNFEVVEEGETTDENESKIHRLPVFVKWTVYRYKGFSTKIIVMESKESAVKRAKRMYDEEELERQEQLKEKRKK